MLQQNNGNDNRKKPDIMDAFEHLNGHGWSEYRALKPAEDQCDAGKTEKDSPTPIDAVADKREAPGLPTKIQASDGTLAYDNTANGTYSYVVPVGGLLPVELSSFASAAQGRTIVLNWSTKTEKNSDRFEVERSLVTNGSWLTVGTVKASVLSNSPKSYSY